MMNEQQYMDWWNVSVRDAETGEEVIFPEPDESWEYQGRLPIQPRRYLVSGHIGYSTAFDDWNRQQPQPNSNHDDAILSDEGVL